MTGPFAGAAILGAGPGERLAVKATCARLRRAFAVVPLAVAAFTLVDVLT
ncbi:hypothetical protein [Streptomyces buecherae]|uniref:Uncharacterized protein n=1 Tax=Streptomyces buecherae TaxID=2763006 RepID=A0A7H8NGH4_9ACTN|nr:hypothetical protein HUT08_32565 [Streptomyces buecherae]